VNPVSGPTQYFLVKKKKNYEASYLQNRLTLSSKAPTATPDAAPDPASPMKCSLPMLLANSDAPTCNTRTQFTTK